MKAMGKAIHMNRIFVYLIPEIHCKTLTDISAFFLILRKWGMFDTQ